jgi:hypothetical protein
MGDYLKIAVIVGGALLVWTYWPQIQSSFQNFKNDQCKTKWSQSGMSAEYAYETGCMVTINGRRVPEANVQIGPKNSN